MKIGSCALELFKQRYKDCRFMLEIEHCRRRKVPGQDLENPEENTVFI